MDANGNCRICNCPWNIHYHQKYRYEMVKETKIQSSNSIRKLYQGVASDALNNEELLEKIQQEIDEDEKQLFKLVQATYPHITRLNDIALRPHPMSTLAYIDMMVESEKRNNRPDLQERIKRLQKLRKMAELTKIIVNHQSSHTSKLRRKHFMMLQ